MITDTIIISLDLESIEQFMHVLDTKLMESRERLIEEYRKKSKNYKRK